jgi:hypothetical protein
VETPSTTTASTTDEKEKEIKAGVEVLNLIISPEQNRLAHNVFK